MAVTTSPVLCVCGERGNNGEGNWRRLLVGADVGWRFFVCFGSEAGSYLTKVLGLRVK